MAKTDDTHEIIYKLCKKYGKTSPISEPIVNIYLSQAEYNTLAQLPATQTKKLRYDVDYQGIHFMVNFYLEDGPITVETEFATEAEAENCPIPPFCGEEVSNDAAFEGKSLATNPGGP
jgi:CYTH domain-containing protein